MIITYKYKYKYKNKNTYKFKYKCKYIAGGQEAQWREEGGWRPLACQVGTQLILKHCTSGLGQEAQTNLN